MTPAQERAAREAKWRKAYNAVLKARAGMLTETTAEVERLLKTALADVKTALASAPSEYQAWQLPQLQAEIERALSTMGTQGARVLSAAADQAWQLGVDTLDKPIAAAGVQITGLMPHLDTKQLEAMRFFMTDKMRDVGAEAIRKVNSELGLTMIGARPMSDTITRVQDLLGGSSRKRAITITRTELGRVYSVAAHERARQAEDAGAPMDKVWRRSGKLRPRIEHAVVDGQRVALDQPFHVNGHLMMHPHDPTAPASETINCGCVVLYRPRAFGQTLPDHKPFTEHELSLSPRLVDIEEARATGKSIHAGAAAILESKAYVAAKAGGRHGGLLRRLADMGPVQMRKSVKSLQSTVDLHREKLANPAAYCDGWAARSPEYRAGLLAHWQVEIDRVSEEIEVIEGYRNEQGK